MTQIKGNESCVTLACLRDQSPLLDPVLLISFPSLRCNLSWFWKMAASTKQESKAITLKGSAELVAEFFGNFTFFWIFEFICCYSKPVLFSFSPFLGRLWDKQVSFYLHVCFRNTRDNFRLFKTFCCYKLLMRRACLIYIKKYKRGF